MIKKTIFTVAICLYSIILFAQKKPDIPVKTGTPDTTVVIRMNINDYKKLHFFLDQNIDSKKSSQEIKDFLNKSAKIELGPAKKE